ncbi:hypothetical protein Nos7524_1829 [Nostoc sp. PCC 7524]|uniref:Franean1_4349 family RiPP n=1 Tax=Nostoc sp. (strain ATCC 29411 / PCC 7524) TaxID=28072 RepID=UPI00029ED8A1|nr:Os1348 family NHLP clan protein [Nostoc sp. PCC 7524]AFY47692.1 hypothetical protein Nos7524_1829 [Nostoc sp. PCC 7524]
MFDLSAIIGRVMSDESFAQRLVENPEAALQEAGLEPTPEIVEALQGVDLQAIQQLAAAFGEDKAA